VRLDLVSQMKHASCPNRRISRASCTRKKRDPLQPLYPVPNVLSVLCYDAIYLFLQVQKMCHQGKAGEGGALITSDEPNTSDKADTAAPHNTPETNNHLRHTAAPALGANTLQSYPCSRAKQLPTVWFPHQEHQEAGKFS
jgi:hypothetical protein